MSFCTEAFFLLQNTAGFHRRLFTSLILVLCPAIISHVDWFGNLFNFKIDFISIEVYLLTHFWQSIYASIQFNSFEIQVKAIRVIIFIFFFLFISVFLWDSYPFLFTIIIFNRFIVLIRQFRLWYILFLRLLLLLNFFVRTIFVNFSHIIITFIFLSIFLFLFLLKELFPLFIILIFIR